MYGFPKTVNAMKQAMDKCDMSDGEIALAISNLAQSVLMKGPWLPQMLTPAGDIESDMFPKEAAISTKSKFFSNRLIRDYCCVVHNNNADLPQQPYNFLYVIYVIHICM